MIFTKVHLLDEYYWRNKAKKGLSGVVEQSILSDRFVALITEVDCVQMK